MLTAGMGEGWLVGFLAISAVFACESLRRQRSLPVVQVWPAVTQWPREAFRIMSSRDEAAEPTILPAAGAVHVVPHPVAGGGHRERRAPIASLEAAVLVAIERAVVGGHALGPVGV